MADGTISCVERAVKPVSTWRGRLVRSLDLAPIERATVVEEIVQRLEGMILDHRLKPGDKLPSERELM
jgi:hypothetical protein